MSFVSTCKHILKNGKHLLKHRFYECTGDAGEPSLEPAQPRKPLGRAGPKAQTDMSARLAKSKV